jgi:hypothetical protein
MRLCAVLVLGLGVGSIVTGCSSPIQRRPMGPMVSTDSGAAAVFAPLVLEEQTPAMLARKDASLRGGGWETAEYPLAGERLDLRTSRRARMSTDSATYIYYPREPRREW